MRFKDLETAKKHLIPIFSEEKLPSKTTFWAKNLSEEEIDRLLNIEKEDDIIRNECYVVSEYSELSSYEDYLACKIGHSRRGQYYYILCNIKNLELSIIATKPDGEGADVQLPDCLLNWIINGDVIL